MNINIFDCEIRCYSGILSGTFLLLMNRKQSQMQLIILPCSSQKLVLHVVPKLHDEKKEGKETCAWEQRREQRSSTADHSF